MRVVSDSELREREVEEVRAQAGLRHLEQLATLLPTTRMK